MPEALLLGNTVTAMIVGDAAIQVGIRMTAVVLVPKSFTISYSSRRCCSSRHADIPWREESPRYLPPSLGRAKVLCEIWRKCHRPRSLVAPHYPAPVPRGRPYPGEFTTLEGKDMRVCRELLAVALYARGTPEHIMRLP